MFSISKIKREFPIRIFSTDGDEMVHILRGVDSEEFSEIVEAAQRGMVIDDSEASEQEAKRAREMASREAFTSSWDRLIVRVEGYGADVDALRGDALRAWFASPPASAEDMRLVRDELFYQRQQAVTGWLDEQTARASFRGQHSGSGQGRAPDRGEGPRLVSEVAV